MSVGLNVVADGGSCFIDSPGGGSFSIGGLHLLGSRGVSNLFDRATKIVAPAMLRNTSVHHAHLETLATIRATYVMPIILYLATTIVVVHTGKGGAVIVSYALTAVEVVIMSRLGQSRGRVG